MAQPRNRIVDLIDVRAGDLKPDPRNWRTHPDEQREAMEASWHRIGNIDVLRVRKDAAGDYVLLDGHLRASIDPDTTLPCILLDLDESEAGEALATFDPIGAMAGSSNVKLRALLKGKDVGFQSLMRKLEAAEALPILHPESVPAIIRPKAEPEDTTRKNNNMQILDSRKAHVLLWEGDRTNLPPALETFIQHRIEAGQTLTAAVAEMAEIIDTILGGDDE